MKLMANWLCVPFLITWLSAASFGQHIMSGKIAAGSYTFTDRDVRLENVVIVPGTGNTLSVVVTNGTLTVGKNPCTGDGIIGNGKDGKKGGNGAIRVNPCVPVCVSPTAGGNAANGFNVYLETKSRVGGTSNLDIVINRPIDCHGGTGGSGGEGCPEYVECKQCTGSGYNCYQVTAGNGLPGGQGGNGGNITIKAGGALDVTSVLNASGGNGGPGGAGGAASYYGAGTPAAGGAGGSGGTINLDQIGDGAMSLYVTACSGFCPAGRLLSYGGTGGSGGAGASGVPASAGASGGNAGGGGSVSLLAMKFGMYAACLDQATIETVGGQGGAGGDGAAGGQYVSAGANCNGGFEDCPARGCHAPAAGSDGGDAGLAGGGGPINVASAYVAEVNMYCIVTSNGGPGGRGGSGGDGKASTCDFACGTCQDVSAGGPPGMPTAGGQADKIDFLASGTVTFDGSVLAVGGVGGAGGNGGGPGIGCCKPPADESGQCLVCNGPGRVSAPSTPGSNGAAGGAGNMISVTAGTFIWPVGAVVQACGGSGGRGGDGSHGGSPAAGGSGGAVGGISSFTVNGVLQPNICTGALGSPGSPGLWDDLSLPCFCQ